MEWLRQWFGVNQVVVFAVYGQVFFTLGLALGLQSLKYSRLELGKHLRWLALFGLTHGLVEWGYVFIPIQASYMSAVSIEALHWFQLFLMIISFVFLLQFGLRTAFGERVHYQTEGLWVFCLMLIAFAFGFGLPHEESHEAQRASVEIWIRYLMAVPAAALSAYGVYRSADQAVEVGLPRVIGWLRLSAISLGGYSALNLVTPVHHHLLANWLHYQNVTEWIIVPTQVWRTVVGTGMLFGMTRSLAMFEVETNRLLMEANQRKLLEARSELSCMNQIAVTLGRSRNPNLAMKAVLNDFLPFLRCHSGEIAIRDEERGQWRIAAWAGRLPPDYGEASWVPSALIQQVAATGQFTVDEAEPGRFSGGIPIQASGNLLAVAVVYRDYPLKVSPQEAQVINSLGNLLGISLENSRLWSALQQREADRTEWIGRIISAQEDERRRVSRELHDDTIQTLVLLCRRLDLLQELPVPVPAEVQLGLEQTRRQVEELIGSLRRFAHELRPPALDELGLVSCLERLLGDFGNRTGATWSFRSVGDPYRFHRNAEVGLYRIAQEAVRNVEHHAMADSVQVEIKFEALQVCLTVADNGKGLSRTHKDASPAHRGLGLLGMRERASLLGGELLIRSRPGKGTTLAATIPVHQEPDLTGESDSSTLAAET